MRNNTYTYNIMYNGFDIANKYFILFYSIKMG